MNLLIVEDDGAVARAISRLLRMRGYDITHAASYAEGLAQTRTFDCFSLSQRPAHPRFARVAQRKTCQRPEAEV